MKIFFLYFFVLSSVSFFDLSLINDSFIAVSQLVSLAVLIIYWLKGMKTSVPLPFKKGLYLLGVAVISGLFSSILIWDQPFYQAIIVHRELGFFLTLPYLIYTRPKPQDIIKCILFFSLLFSIIYIAQYLLYPTVIVKSNILLERNTVRIYMIGTFFLYFGTIWSCYQVFYQHELKYFLIFGFFITVVVLRGTRSEIFANFVPIALIAVNSIRVRRLNIVYLGIGCLLIVYFFSNIIAEIDQSSQNSIERGKEDVRVNSTVFFLFQFPKNAVSYISGNGIASENNSYGQLLKNVKINDGFFLSDIGLIGDYLKFGPFFLLGLLSVFRTIFKVKIRFAHRYLKFLFLGILISITINSPLTFASGIVPFSLFLYLIYCSSRSARYKMFYQAQQCNSFTR